MKNIIIIRHSKSSWDSPVIDFERKLTTEGIEKAIKMANYTKELIPSNATIYSSNAFRAAQTAKLFVDNWGLSSDIIIYTNKLYVFDCISLESFVKKCPDTIDNLILFGHNSAITDFVNKFGTIFIDNVPTAGFISIKFEMDSWKTLKKGIINKIIFPRDISL